MAELTCETTAPLFAYRSAMESPCPHSSRGSAFFSVTFSCRKHLVHADIQHPRLVVSVLNQAFLVVYFHVRVIVRCEPKIFHMFGIARVFDTIALPLFDFQMTCICLGTRKLNECAVVAVLSTSARAVPVLRQIARRAARTFFDVFIIMEQDTPSIAVRLRWGGMRFLEKTKIQHFLLTSFQHLNDLYTPFVK